MVRGTIACLIYLIFRASGSVAQAAVPADCKQNSGGFFGSDAVNSLYVTSGTPISFSLNSLTGFETNAPTPANNFAANVILRGSKYRLYIAGKVQYIEIGRTDLIPVSTFTVTPVFNGTVPGTVSLNPRSLSGNYQVNSQNTSSNLFSIDRYQFNLDRAKLNTFRQAPGEYQLKIYFCYCWY